MRKHVVDIFEDTCILDIEKVETDNDADIRAITSRVASLNVVNRNNRLLPTGILGENKTYIAQSRYDHDSIRPPGGFFSSAGTVFPAGQGLLSEKDGPAAHSATVRHEQAETGR